jgi:hypothetical protein
MTTTSGNGESTASQKLNNNADNSPSKRPVPPPKPSSPGKTADASSTTGDIAAASASSEKKSNQEAASKNDSIKSDAPSKNAENQALIEQESTDLRRELVHDLLLRKEQENRLADVSQLADKELICIVHDFTTKFAALANNRPLLVPAALEQVQRLVAAEVATSDSRFEKRARRQQMRKSAAVSNAKSVLSSFRFDGQIDAVSADGNAHLRLNVETQAVVHAEAVARVK